MGISSQPAWVKTLDEIVGQGDLKDNLVVLSLQIVEFFQDMLPRIMMIAAQGHTPPNLPHSIIPPPFSARSVEMAKKSAIAQLTSPPNPAVQDFDSLTCFFEREQALGRIRSGNPQTAAYMLLGSLMHYVFVGYMRGDPSLSVQPSVYVQETIEAFWRGFAPD